MNECLFMGAEHEFLFLPSKCDIFLYLYISIYPTACQGHRPKEPGDLGVSLRVLGPSYLIWFSSLSSFYLSVLLAVLDWNVAAHLN